MHISSVIYTLTRYVLYASGNLSVIPLPLFFVEGLNPAALTIKNSEKGDTKTSGS